MYLYQVYRTDGGAVNSHTADSQIHTPQTHNSSSFRFVRVLEFP